jgi:hypothetical protein
VILNKKSDESTFELGRWLSTNKEEKAKTAVQFGLITSKMKSINLCGMFQTLEIFSKDRPNRTMIGQKRVLEA